MKITLIKISYTILFTVIMAGCSSTRQQEIATEKMGLDDYSIEYKKSRQVDTLELPPSFSSARIKDTMIVPRGRAENYSDFSREDQAGNLKSEVLPEQEDIRVERDGNSRWLVVDAPPGQVWEKVREFWVSLGFLLIVEEPQTGIMETDWKENRADIPDGFIREILGSVVESAYSAPTRDSFRIRIERGDDQNQTEIFISHRGVLEKSSGENSTSWEARSAEPELEAEMLRRLMVFMGIEDAKARTRLAELNQGVVRARLVKDKEGNVLLDYWVSYPRAWRIVGLALDRVGFTVEDRDRSKGIYFVRYSDPLKDVKPKKKGLFSFWSNDEESSEEQYQVVLSGDETSTQITIQDKDSQRDKTKTSSRILALLYEQIR